MWLTSANGYAKSVTRKPQRVRLTRSSQISRWASATGRPVSGMCSTDSPPISLWSAAIWRISLSVRYGKRVQPGLTEGWQTRPEGT